MELLPYFPVSAALQPDNSWKPQENIFLLPHLLAPVGEARVPSNPALEVELALPVPAEVNGAGLDVDVHQVINNPALDVILNPVDQEPPAHVDDFDERKFPGDRQTSL